MIDIETEWERERRAIQFGHRIDLRFYAVCAHWGIDPDIAFLAGPIQVLADRMARREAFFHSVRGALS